MHPRPCGGASRAAQVGNARAAVLVVVSPGERNWVDQQWLQASLREKHGVRTVRYTLAEVAALGARAARRRFHPRRAHATARQRVSYLAWGPPAPWPSAGSIASDGSLVVDGHAISVVYYRAGCGRWARETLAAPPDGAVLWSLLPIPRCDRTDASLSPPAAYYV